MHTCTHTYILHTWFIHSFIAVCTPARCPHFQTSLRLKNFLNLRRFHFYWLATPHTKIKKTVLMLLSMQHTTHVKSLSHPPSQKSCVILQEQRRNMAPTRRQHGRGHTRRGNDGGLVLKWKKSLEKILETAWSCLLLFTLHPCCSVNMLLYWLLSISYSESLALTVFRANNRLRFVEQRDNPIGQPLWHKIIRFFQSSVKTGVIGTNTAWLLLRVPTLLAFAWR